MTELIRRKSRMVLLKAQVLMPVQPRLRMKLRRGMMMEGADDFIGLALDGEVGAGNNQVDERANAVTFFGRARTGIGVADGREPGPRQTQPDGARAVDSMDAERGGRRVGNRIGPVDGRAERAARDAV